MANSQPATTSDAATTTLDEIEKLIDSKRIKEAKRHLEKRLLKNPNDVDALSLAAHAAFVVGEVDQSVSLLDLAASVSPEQAVKFSVSAADLLASSGKWSQSIKRYEELLVDHPADNNLRHRLAEILNRRGFRFDANEHVRQLCRQADATPRELQGLISPVRSYTGFSQKPDINDAQQVAQLGR